MYYSNSEGHNDQSWRNNADELERSAVKLENTFFADWTLTTRFPGAQQKCDGSGIIEGANYDYCAEDYARCPGCIACFDDSASLESDMERARRAA